MDSQHSFFDSLTSKRRREDQLGSQSVDELINNAMETPPLTWSQVLKLQGDSLTKEGQNQAPTLRLEGLTELLTRPQILHPTSNPKSLPQCTSPVLCAVPAATPLASASVPSVPAPTDWTDDFRWTAFLAKTALDNPQFLVQSSESGISLGEEEEESSSGFAATPTSTLFKTPKMEDASLIPYSALIPVSYTHLTLPTICSV
eukprot:TRINITY_DN1979_c0_g1_i1.p1 TRINITY_DN1979_c0_g1~~TRINITY_DN1979_c0_g1_i1.p1  ORF type:complete len:202 (-),score=26.28 TRINITY_DN1979_c0_g1_i1:9-614(-)